MPYGIDLNSNRGEKTHLGACRGAHASGSEGNREFVRVLYAYGLCIPGGASAGMEPIQNGESRRHMRTIILLTISNIFMTFAWYGHLKFRTSALWKVILVSWGIAFFEYCFQVPANRIGSYEFTTAQLKTIQEVITLSVFSAFSVLYLGEKIKWNYAAGFGCIVLAAFFVFHKW